MPWHRPYLALFEVTLSLLQIEAAALCDDLEEH
jgi:hypothetical protein